MRIVRAAGWVALLLALIAAVGIQLPLRPGFLEATLDGSFAAVLHQVAAQPLAQRPRLISTYGPLGFTHFSFYLPETYFRMLAVRGAIASVLGWAIAWLGWAVWASPWAAALAVVCCTPLLSGADARCFLLLAMVPLLELAPVRQAPAPLRLALGAALGLLALIKVTFVTAGLIVLAPLAIADVLRRRLPVAALAALATATVGWLLLGLGAADLAAYLDWSLREITPGYTAAMQMRTSPALVMHAIAVSAALLGWVIVLAWRRQHGWWWAPTLAVAGILLLQFKTGFVRADVHVFRAAFALLLEAVLLAVLSGRSRGALAFAVALVVALPGTLLWHALAVNGTAQAHFVSPRDLVERLAALPAIVRGRTFAATHEQKKRNLRAMVPMPAFDGGVDMIAHHQSLLLANGAPYRPRPVFQSYMAYTPRLAHANAAYLASPAAPRWLLFDPLTIDGRFPAQDDAAAWPVLLSAYQPAGVVGRYALLERRATPLRWRLVPLGGVDTQTDVPVAVPPPSGGPIWARIAVDETLGDRVTAFLFTAPYEYLDIVYTTRAVWRARLVPAIAADGFLLSPVAGTVPAFVALSEQGAPALPNQVVQQFRVHVDSPFVRNVRRAVRVDFARLEIAR